MKKYLVLMALPICMSLSGCHISQQIPVSPGSKAIVPLSPLPEPPIDAPVASRSAGVQDKAAADLYRVALAVWSKGEPAQAELLVRAAREKFPDDQRLTFFAALLARARFDFSQARPLFVQVSNHSNKLSAETICANAILVIDAGHPYSLQAFGNLKQVADQYPKDPLPQWLVCIAARTLNRSTDGLVYYRRLIRLVEARELLVRQIFANEPGDLALNRETDANAGLKRVHLLQSNAAVHP